MGIAVLRGAMNPSLSFTFRRVHDYTNHLFHLVNRGLIVFPTINRLEPCRHLALRIEETEIAERERT